MKKIIVASILLISTIVILVSYFNHLIPKEEIITIKTEDKEEDLFLEEYIIGVVACEMPALFEEEALKAQAIASRTYALNQASNDLTLLITTDDQCYITIDEMQDKWGSDYDLYYNKIKDIVNSTKSIVMTKEDKLFKSFYFSTSNGYTEDSKTVFKEENLVSVASSWDKNVKNFEVTTTFTKEELVDKLGVFNNIKIISRSKTNRVEKVSVDDKTYTGITFRKLLGLRSTDFKIQKQDNKYLITTYGYGHGVGMSQNGANELAKLGYDYKYILNYYYSGVEFKNTTYNL